MNKYDANQLLARLAGKHVSEDADDPWKSLEAKNPEHYTESGSDDAIDAALARINQLAAGGKAQPGRDSQAASHSQPSLLPAVELPSGDLMTADGFTPREPRSLQEAHLTETEVESIAIKYLLSCGEASGRQISDQLKLPFLIIEECLRHMKYDQLVVYKDTAMANDYVYFLTDLGRERAKRYSEHCTYFGSAPVSLKDYIDSVRAQSLERQHPNLECLEAAFDDLLINRNMFRRLGPAINSGRGLFLYGAPGNGKTSIAERVTRAFGQYIWVPRAIGIDGDILRVFDPSVHEEAPAQKSEGLLQEGKLDQRWVQIKRPTIVVGGELTMGNLEIHYNASTGVSEAPLQVKSNCGTLVIDDFGRQRMSTDELLNRWIVPLEKRYDFLNMPSGKKIQVPFDQLIVFSTNLEPRDLCDDAFLRRIPYKIEVVDPTEEEFRQLFQIMCPLLGFEYDETAIDHLIKKHYLAVERPFRCCQPRDLLLQIRNLCLFDDSSLKLTPDYFDAAVENYFAVM